MFRDDVALGFQQTISLLKQANAKIPQSRAITGPIQRSNLPLGSAQLLSIPSAPWLANQRLEIEWHLLLSTGINPNAASSPPGFVFRLKKGTLTLAQTTLMVTAWSSSRVLYGQTTMNTRGLASIGISNTFTYTNLGGSFGHPEVVRERSSQSFALSPNDNSPILWEVITQNPSTAAAIQVNDFVITQANYAAL
jgi:hypothetical protein